MKLIVWLGNPGSEYAKTRHNAGFLFVDYLRAQWGFPDWRDSKYKGVISEWLRHGEKIILLKPTTYMNLSGESIVPLMHFYKIPEENLLTAFDDLDMEFGKIRYRDKGSAGGHNGIKSTIEHLGSDAFARIKIGIGRDERYAVSDWVLSKFSETELKNLQETAFLEAFALVEKWMR